MKKYFGLSGAGKCFHIFGIRVKFLKFLSKNNMKFIQTLLSAGPKFFAEFVKKNKKKEPYRTVKVVNWITPIGLFGLELTFH